MRPPYPARAMRERPDLDQLKRQAKELREAFVAGDPAAVDEVNAHYRDADAAMFALHDAQLVLARAYGLGSWPKLKAYVDGVTVKRLADAVRSGDVTRVRAMLQARPELVHMDMAENDEHRALHYAVLDRSPGMVRLLMEHGADARKGIYPHRDATSALTIATERADDEIVAIIHEIERRRREGSPGSNTPVSAAQDELTESIWRGDETRALALLASDLSLTNGSDRRGWTPLHAAAATLNVRLVTLLLERGADANRRGPGDRTPLDVADGSGWRTSGGLERFSVVAALLRRRGAKLTARSAVALGDVAWLQARHAEGALVNVIEGPGGLLSIAVRHDLPGMLSLLLDLGLDPDERTRLHDVEEVFHSWGMPLHHCAALGRHAMAETLLERGADPNGEVYASGSVMYSALTHGDAAMVALLERYGGIVDAATAGWRCMTGHARQMFADEAAGRLREGTIRPGQRLADVLLWSAANGGDPEIVRMALQHVDWSHPDGQVAWHLVSCLPGRSPRSAADHERFLACFRLILERSDPNVRHPRFGRTILHDVAAGEPAVSAEAIHFATLLIDAGARLDVRDDVLESTPLGWACRWGNAGLVELFLARGAEPVEADAKPWATPAAWATKMGHEDVLRALRQHGS